MIKPKLLLLALLIMAAAASFAQLPKPGVTMGGSLFYSNPQGDFKNLYKGGLGGELKGGVGLGKTYLVASIGYAAYASQSGVHNGTLTYRPVKLGVKRYFLAKRFFLNSDIGVASIKDKTMNNAETRFSYDAGGGIRLLGMEAGLYYNNWNNVNGGGAAKTVEFKVGYNFTL